jgi:sporulation protein YunB
LFLGELYETRVCLLQVHFYTKWTILCIHWLEVMEMRRKPWRVHRRIKLRKFWLFVTVLAVVLLVAAGYRRLEGLMVVYGENRCRNLVTQLLLDTVGEMEMYEKLSTFTIVDNKSVVQMDSSAVRQYQAAIGKTLAQKLDALGAQTHQVPLGTVLDNPFLMERGPNLPIRFAPVGSAQVEISSDLCDAGINQVLYRVIMTLSAELTVLLPGGSTNVVCRQDFILEEILLTGQVPLLYGG